MMSDAQLGRRAHAAFTCSSVRSKLTSGGWRDAEPTCHFVQVYERDESLLTALTDYVAEGLNNNENVIVIATPAHTRAVDQRLRNQHIEPLSAPFKRRLTVLDADAVLARFMIGGMPDPELFDIVVGSLVRQAGQRNTPVRAYGEMVALLVAANRSAAALRLEQLWNALASQARFSLFCAYPASCFHGPGGDSLLRDVCRAHARVIPNESFAS